ncbi:S8 family peptidase [Streptomyces pactum]|uniref:S8 family peptidase n=1 Tax=Streptomyces pactum TaxID=68249 RepID=A0ABS0NNL9_9ACTN|nr:S8 family peptidase [Streptomyces pactum]MBH5336773.1 S8 family peptidase [Streptomyces pactum]
MKHATRTSAVAAAAALPLLLGALHLPPAAAAGTGKGTGASTGPGTVHIVQLHGVGTTEDEVTAVAREMTARYGGELRRTYHSAIQGFSATLTDDQVARYYKDTRIDSVTGDRTYSVAGRPSGTPPTAVPGAHTPPPDTPGTVPTGGSTGGGSGSAAGGSAGGTTAAGASGGGVQFGHVPWGLDRIDQRDLPLDRTYRFPGTAGNVRVYVVDTGVRTGHQEFGGRARGAYDAITRTVGGGGTDCAGHGTASASIAAGRYTGVAKSARVESVRAFGCDGTASLEHLLTAVDWITANAVKPAVVNLGFSGPPGSVLDLQLYEMTRQGIAYTAAAGNGGPDGAGVESCETTPARQTTAITVAATDPGDRRPAWSNYGYCVHLFAPGTDIPAASAAGSTAYTQLTGTSAATAEVTGAAALHLSAHPAASPEEIDRALAEAATADRVRDPGEASKNLLLHIGGATRAGGTR